MKIYTILGAGGSIGDALAKELIEQKNEVRLVSRSGYNMPGAKSVKGDLTVLSEAISSIKGSSIVFLCVGLPYDYKVWEKYWPRIMNHTIEACKRTNAKLIFFDNVYMYGHVKGIMTEKTPCYPSSKKGEVRADISRHLCREIKDGSIIASIARSADLYGPYATITSLPYLMVFNRLIKGQQAQWLMNDNVIHSFTYTTDAAKAMILLANNDQSYNTIWHLPTCNPGITGMTFIEIAAKELGVNPKHQVLSRWMLKFAGFFNKTIKENIEMLYQNEFDYCFDSTKFDQKFQFEPTSYQLGISETISFLKSVK